MSKKRLVQTIQPVVGGPVYGQNSHPNDIMLAQQYSHEHTEQVVKDFLVGQDRIEVAGFEYELVEGNNQAIQINAPGRAYNNATGRSFDLQDDAVLAIEESDDLPRIDLVYALLEEEVPASTTLIPFTRLRTLEELADSVPPYPPTQYNQPTERWNTATVFIRKGTPAATPSLPVINSNEVALLAIQVGANVAKVRYEDIRDLRLKTPRLRNVFNKTEKADISIGELQDRVARLENIGNQPIDLTPIYGSIKSLSEILALLGRRIDRVSLPEVNNPNVAPSSANAGKMVATGNVESSVPCVDIDLGGSIRFGDTEYQLHPKMFADSTRNARFAQVSGGAASEKVTTNLTLANVTLLDSDGDTDFVERAATFGTARSRPASAARDSRYIEIFGGLSSDNSSGLGDWYTYDTLNDTLTVRTFSGVTPPNADRPALYPCGNGTDMLLVCGRNDTHNPRWFRFNAVTGVCVEKTGTLPEGINFFGDLIATDKIFIVTIDKTGGYITEFWHYNVALDTFTALGVSGNVPECFPDFAHGCCFEFNKFMLVKFQLGVPSSGKTYLFDFPSLTWTELNISSPYQDGADKQNPISEFRLSCINGRPTLVGGLLYKSTDKTKALIWELKSIAQTPESPSKTGYSWFAVEASFAPIQSPACSALIKNGLPMGKGGMFAGMGSFSDAKNKTYESIQAGLIADTVDGQDAITLAPSSSFATFIIEDHIAAWDVAGYYASFAGAANLASVLKLEVSFDNGVHYHTIMPDKLFTVTDSTNPGHRKIRVTMYNYKTVKPRLTKLTEIFDQDGAQLTDRFVLRYDIITGGIRYLYIDRNGIITIESVATPSTTDKAILHRTTPDGSSAPDVKNYINKRRPRVRYRGTAGGSTPEIDNELAVEPAYVFTIGIAASHGEVYKVADPTFGFDDVITVADIASGDDYLLDIEG